MLPIDFCNRTSESSCPSLSSLRPVSHLFLHLSYNWLRQQWLWDWLLSCLSSQFCEHLAAGVLGQVKGFLHWTSLITFVWCLVGTSSMIGIPDFWVRSSGAEEPAMIDMRPALCNTGMIDAGQLELRNYWWLRRDHQGGGAWRGECSGGLLVDGILGYREDLSLGS